MKHRLFFMAAIFLSVAPFATAVQKVRKPLDVDPPKLGAILAGASGQSTEALADVLAIKPEIPLGPPDLLNEYEQGMELIAQNLSAEIGIIRQAKQAQQITGEQADYLIRERYQVAMMQHQVLSALHDVLESDMDQAASPKRFGQAESDAPVVLELPAFSRSGENQ